MLTSLKCMTKFCEQNDFIAENDDVLVGFVGWGAGGFDGTYVLTLTPSRSGDAWTDNKLMKQCIIAPFGKAASATASTTQAPTSTTTTSTSATSTEQAADKTPSATPGTKNANANEAAPKKGNAADHVAISHIYIILASMAGLQLYL